MLGNVQASTNVLVTNSNMKSKKPQMSAANLHRRPSNRYEIDAISVPLSVGEVVTEMRSINADRFTTVFENSDVIPHDLVISEAWPAAV